MKKVYVDVEVRWSKEGGFIPIAILWNQSRDEMERYEIKKIIDGPIEYAPMTGGVAMRYEVKLGSSRRYLFFDKSRWFIETNR